MPLTQERYEQRVATDPTYRHTAQRWRDHLRAYLNCDRTTRQNCEELIREYETRDTKDSEGMQRD